MRRLWYNGRVDTMGVPMVRYEAIGIQDGTILFLGSDREALSQWESLPRHQGLSLYAGLALYKAGTDADGGTWLSQDNIIALQAQEAFAAGWQGVVLYSSDSLTAPAAQAEVANAAALLGK